MSETELPIIVSPVFMDRLFELEQYVGRDAQARGREFTGAVFDFLHDTLGPFPLSFPSYSLARHPELRLRRAVFRKRYNIIYEVTPEAVHCLTIFVAAQDPTTISL
ncbi:MAG: hypothetical protein M3Y54_19660 [Bacteroidota bacterium]|nr:hypothetical protein [Bacteroidota bacterium]